MSLFSFCVSVIGSSKAPLNILIFHSDVFCSTVTRLPSAVPAKGEFYDVVHSLPPSSTRYVPDQLMAMMFLPTTLTFSDPLFGCLSYSREAIPIKYNPPNETYFLSPVVMSDWRNLERHLLIVYAALADPTQTPPSFKGAVSPSRFGFTKAFATESAARHAAIASRDAFHLLAAAITMWVCFWNAAGEEAPPRWILRLPQSIQPLQVTELSHSIICDFSCPRLGGFLDVRTCGFLHFVDALAYIKAPVYLLWGEAYAPQSYPRASNGADHLKPSASAFKNAFQNRLLVSILLVAGVSKRSQLP